MLYCSLCASLVPYFSVGMVSRFAARFVGAGVEKDPDSMLRALWNDIATAFSQQVTGVELTERWPL